MSPAEVSIVFFAQLFVIVVAARVIGWLGKRYLGQPQVVGEMIAGVVLGPSLFGLLAPDLQALIFPPGRDAWSEQETGLNVRFPP